MKLTNTSEYAILALIYIARNSNGSNVQGETISQAQSIPKKFLQQILHTLKRAKIIKSERGKSGGYMLDRPATEVNLAEIVRLFEGPLAASRSASEHFYATTPIEKEKKVISLLKEVRKLVSDRLEATNLSDLL